MSIDDGLRHEKARQHGIIVELNNTDISELAQLKEQIRLTSGNIDILVHPFYESDESERMFPSTSKYLQERDALITEAVKQGKPLIIFQDPEHSLDSIARSLGGTMYTVSTANDNPTPVSRSEYRQGAYKINDPERWNKLMSLFQSLGARHARVGGKYLRLDAPYNESQKGIFEKLQKIAEHMPHARSVFQKGLLPDGCPGIVIRQLLLHNIDVSISEVSHPKPNI